MEITITDESALRFARNASYCIGVVRQIEAIGESAFKVALCDALRNDERGDWIVSSYNKMLRFCLDNKAEFLRDNLCF